MKATRLATASGLALALVLAIPAMGEEGRQSQGGGAVSGGGTFGQLDRDQNGYLSQSEVQDVSELTESWSAIDANADSQIDKSEFSAFETGSGYGDSMREGHPSFLAPSEGPPGGPGSETRGIPGVDN